MGVRLVSEHPSIPYNPLSPFLHIRTHEETAHVKMMSQVALYNLISNFDSLTYWLGN